MERNARTGRIGKEDGNKRLQPIDGEEQQSHIIREGSTSFMLLELSGEGGNKGLNEEDEKESGEGVTLGDTPAERRSFGVSSAEVSNMKDISKHLNKQDREPSGGIIHGEEK